MSIAKLKPCPFCGGEVHIAVSSDGYGVECSNDKCIDMLRLDAIPTEAEAIQAWNTRAERTCRDAGNWLNHWECSECGSIHSWERPNYCPNCGCKVVE